MKKMRLIFKTVFRRTSKYRIIGTVVIVITCLYYLARTLNKRDGEYDFLYLDIPDENLSPIGLNKMEDFPISEPDKIPKIVHQTWITSDIPSLYIPWVTSWSKNHPDWEYWFWTDGNTRQFIAEKYPDFLTTFDSYSEPIRRADAMRYFILYEFGGVYADLDLESLQSLNPLIRKYHCFVGQEPYVHSVLDSNFEHLAINAVMGCRKKHPFMKLLIDKLPQFAHMWHVLDSTGPHFMTLWFQHYKSHHYPDTHTNGTYLTPPEYFFPIFDPLKLSSFHSNCQKYHTLSTIQRRACVHLKKTSLQPVNLKMSFTNHHWIHTYLTSKINLKQPVNIHELIPYVKIFTDI